MTNPTSVVIGNSGNGDLITSPIQNTGMLDKEGAPLYAPVVAHSSQIVSPANQTSTAAYVDFAGSTIDSLFNAIVSYTLLNLDGANGLTWQVLAANNASFNDAIVAQAPANIAAAAVGNFAANPALYRYYRVQIIDTVAAAHAAGQLRGIARG